MLGTSSSLKAVGATVTVKQAVVSTKGADVSDHLAAGYARSLGPGADAQPADRGGRRRRTAERLTSKGAADKDR